MQLGQQGFTTQLFELVVHHHPFETSSAGHLAAAGAAHEEVALPRGELVAGIEGEPGWRDGRNPENERLLDPRSERRVRNARSLVVASEAPLRPAVVLARQNHV